MTLTPTAEIVGSAAASRTGVGAFNVVQIESAEAIVAGAEEAGLPVIMQISHNCVRYHGALEPIAAASLAIARAADVPVAVHLDHAETADLVHDAVKLGFTSVMLDASTLPYEQNVAETKRVAQSYHEHGVWVEAELGEIGGKDGAHAPGVRTDPQEASEFVAATGVDGLAVAVGSSHAMTTRDATLDFDLIGRLREHVPVPLVLHGSSGVPNDDLADAVRSGMTKINVSTRLNQVFTGAAAAYLRDHPTVADPRKYLGAGRSAMAHEVRDLLRTLAT
jgi:fructose-bisphosphate aldolase class II